MHMREFQVEDPDALEKVAKIADQEEDHEHADQLRRRAKDARVYLQEVNSRYFTGFR